MSKYIKLEDAIELINHYRFGMNKFAFECMGERLTTMPTIDIVQCKDCLWRDKDDQGEYYCTYAKGLADIGEESFCSWGKG